MAEVDSWLQTLRNSDDEEHALEVKISNNNNELVASIPVDPESSAISLMVSLPAAYPLQQAVVSPRNRVAVSEKNWQSWLRTIKGIIMFSNGGIIDGLLAFRRNVQGALKGQSECAICYSIIGTDMKTPDKKCGTCKNTFHVSLKTSCSFELFADLLLLRALVSFVGSLRATLALVLCVVTASITHDLSLRALVDAIIPRPLYMSCDIAPAQLSYRASGARHE